MSKGGGAGKVYFVLYLAVVLELLIIIVERDEAEEGLHKKQQETMRIVESILTQLQSGSGTEGISTRPQDEITLPPEGLNMQQIENEMNLKLVTNRKYSVEVGVIDIADEIRKRDDRAEESLEAWLSKLMKLSNVEDIDYQVFYSTETNPADPNRPPDFPHDSILKKQDFSKYTPNQSLPDSKWLLYSYTKKKLNLKESLKRLYEAKGTIDTKNLTTEDFVPIYENVGEQVGTLPIPEGIAPDQAFVYSDSLTIEGKHLSDDRIKKRSFFVYFEPPKTSNFYSNPNKSCWFKLRFTTKGNRIMGVRKIEDLDAKQSEEISNEEKVNIGTVQLKVKELENVKRALVSQLSEFVLPDETVLARSLEEFDKMLNNAVIEATEKSKTDQTILGKIRLYGYIIKLLTPAKERDFFPQNYGAIEFNVRVQKPTYTPGNVQIEYQNLVYLDAIPPKFKFKVIGFRGGSPNISINGVPASSVSEIGSETADAALRGLPSAAGARVVSYIAKWNTIFEGGLSQPKVYDVKISYTGGSRPADTTAKIFMYKTKILNEENIATQFESSAEFDGYVDLWDPISPNTGNQISPESFKIKFEVDNDPQGQFKKEVQGFTVPANTFKFPTTSKNATMSFVWFEPIEKQEVSIWKTESKIVQAKPRINRNVTADFNCTRSELVVDVSKIVVARPKNYSKPFKTLNPTITMNIQNYNLGKFSKTKGTPKLNLVNETENDFTYKTTIRITGSLPDNKKELTGSFDLVITATVVNPDNPSETATQTTPIKIYVRCKPRD